MHVFQPRSCCLSSFQTLFVNQYVNLGVIVGGTPTEISPLSRKLGQETVKYAGSCTYYLASKNLVNFIGNNLIAQTSSR